MYDFKKDLLKDENIVYTCRPTPGKGNKQIKESIFLFILATLTQIILFIVNKTKTDLTLDMNIYIIIGVTIVVDLIALAKLIYNLYIKKYNVSDDYFCITTKRILKYEKRINRLSCGYIKKYKYIRIRNEKDGYGDIQFDTYVQDIISKRDLDIPSIDDLKKDYSDLDRIVIESVKNPKKIVKIVERINKKLNK